MVLRYCFGMIMSVSTLMIFSGAATPSSLVNLSIGRTSWFGFAWSGLPKTFRQGFIANAAGIKGQIRMERNGAWKTRKSGQLERFRAKACPGLDPGWIPVRVKKTRQNKNLEPRSDSIGTEKALVRSSFATLPSRPKFQALQPGRRVGGRPGPAR